MVGIGTSTYDFVRLSLGVSPSAATVTHEHEVFLPIGGGGGRGGGGQSVQGGAEDGGVLRVDGDRAEVIIRGFRV